MPPAQIHLLNCGSLDSRFGNVLFDESRPSLDRYLASRCILVVQRSSLVLVDSGIGLVDVAVPWHRLGLLYLAAWRPVLSAAECAASQIAALGYDRGDVRDIILTHLDPNCAGGLGDFPNARVHLARAELDAAASTRPSLNARTRYRPAQWAHGVRWRTYPTFADRWLDFAATAPLPELELEIRLVDLPGHSAGHVGVAIETRGGYLLHAGDAVATLRALDTPRSDPSALHLAGSSLLEFDRAQQCLTRARLRHLVRNCRENVALVCSHDPKPPSLIATIGSSTPE